MFSKKFFILSSLLALIVGCHSYSKPIGKLNPVPLISTPAAISSAQTALPQALKKVSPSIPKETTEPTGNLTLPKAAALALLQNPALAAFSQEIRAQEAAVLQASLLPNPRLGVQGANMGNSDLEGYDGTVTTVQLSQLILLGGKITKRVKVAQLTRNLAGWDYETKRVDVLTQVAQSFIAVLSAQAKLALAQQLVRLAKRGATAVSKQVEAGKVSPVQETKAQVLLSSMRIQLIQAKRELQSARKQLAATWGSTTPRFQHAVGQLSAVSPLPSLEQLLQLINHNPDLARWTTEIAQRRALIDLEKSQAIPDITISLGGSQYANTNGYVVNAGISIPLPLFDRNQGGILKAQRRLTSAEEQQRATKVQIATALNSIYQQLSTAYNEAVLLKTEILPAAQSAFEATKTGFRLGKFNFLSVLDAQRTLFDAKSQYLRALTHYHQTVAEVERLTGGQLKNASTLEVERRPLD